jgi:hypothetical protein
VRVCNQYTVFCAVVPFPFFTLAVFIFLLVVTRAALIFLLFIIILLGGRSSLRLNLALFMLRVVMVIEDDRLGVHQRSKGRTTTSAGGNGVGGGRGGEGRAVIVGGAVSYGRAGQDIQHLNIISHNSQVAAAVEEHSSKRGCLFGGKEGRKE